MVERPEGVRSLNSKYIHVVKRKLGKVDRRKSRLVVLGCGQREGIDYHETFAPVAKANTIRILLALALANNFYLQEMDVDTAFLYAGGLHETTSRCDWNT